MPPFSFPAPLFAPLAIALGCTPLPSGTTAPASGGVQLFVQPDEPSPILSLIGSARASLSMEMYLLTDERALDAIAERAAAGVEVRVILDRSPYLDEQANEPAYARLADAGVLVRWALSRFPHAHAKAFTIDHRRLVISTANLTRAGLDTNREFTLVDDDPADVLAAEALFASDALGSTASTGGRVVSSPENSRPTFLSLLDAASRLIALEVEQLADHGLADALVRAVRRGVETVVVVPASEAGGALARALLAEGVSVRAVADPVIHAKALAVDGRSILVGSANLTPPSLDENRELGLVVEDAALAARLTAAIANDAARGVPPTLERAPVRLY